MILSCKDFCTKEHCEDCYADVADIETAENLGSLMPYWYASPGFGGYPAGAFSTPIAYCCTCESIVKYLTRNDVAKKIKEKRNVNRVR